MLRRLLEIWHQAEQKQSPMQSAENRTNTDAAKAHNAVEAALKELSEAIASVETALQRANADKQSIEATFEEYASQAQALRDAAKNAVNAGDDATAKKLLHEQQSVETMITSYRRMTENVDKTVRALQEQQRRMLVQRDEIKARRTILEAQLSSAASQEEFMRNLHSLGLSHEVLEQELVQAQVRTETGVTNEYALSDQVQAAHNDHSAEKLLATLNAELEQEREQRKHIDAELAQKRFFQTFSGKQEVTKKVDTPPADHSISPQDQMGNFFANVEERKKPETKTESGSPQDQLKNFFDR